ncbi:MAG: tRNA (adenosine(37)-N6)-threonylcarbamoyltransferase complex dimerization subunit type 1 TsaB [Verrucomicrobiae bacterium]|nr:tRNA (adenosine(37)-N6)-threonylcarbamoyltransferase complex dimerization subunit type 1 TsaB [Verrucomicrobiae bacterium]NNJ42586.1 tRNA (adenosine(37)-N6)-threonylcarbamoyltransferase complex dimerization subunit type 1 TsaB [Akkermansiaceae bacterium]
MWRDGEKVFSEPFSSDRNHNSMVFDPLERALERLDGGRLSSILVGTGPGSYSGIRIGIAVAQGLALVHGCPTVGLGSLAATPAARESRGSALPLAVGDARRGLYFIAEIAGHGEAMDAELMDSDALTARLLEAPESVLFTLDDPSRLGLAPEMERRVVRTKPEAGLLIDVWLGLDEGRRSELMAQPLSPSYLRAPYTSKAKAGHPLLRKG